MPMLEIKNLICSYGSPFHLRDINLKVARNEFLGIIGPNGSGKTTLIRAITGILRHREGTVLLQKKDIYKMGYRKLAQKTAVVSQGYSISGFDAEEYVLLGRTPYIGRFQFILSKHDKDAAYKAMDITDTLKFRHRPMNKLSGGEIQRIIIARGLAQEPELLILDEPTSHLDIGHQAEILDLIKRLNEKENLTVISVFHNLNLAGEYCTRLVLLKGGRIHGIGTPEEILTKDIIEDVYKTGVFVQQSPISSRPYVYLVPKPERKRV